jgi:hypothetical protein
MKKMLCIAAVSSLLCGCVSLSKTVGPENRSPSLSLSTPNVDLAPREEKALRPLTIKEALMRQNLTASTTSISYDATLLDVIRSRWYGLLDQVSYKNYRRGIVVIQFRLHDDGRITDLKTAESTVSEMLVVLCQKAVFDRAPFDKWPEEMRQSGVKDFRDIAMTFYYK